MRVTRIFTGEDGESHFEDVDVPLRDLGGIGSMSERIAEPRLSLFIVLG